MGLPSSSSKDLMSTPAPGDAAAGDAAAGLELAGEDAALASAAFCLARLAALRSRSAAVPLAMLLQVSVLVFCLGILEAIE